MKKLFLLVVILCLGVTGVPAQRPNNTNTTKTEKTERKTVDNSERRSSGYQTNGRPTRTPRKTDTKKDDSKTTKSTTTNNGKQRQDRFNGNVAK